ncbi:hypothetical protein BGX27_010522 [Mortierella sp. AM989]|nr:hypothetical protein BGX27_010522 [Mortierella sp. AM989]
MEGSSSIPDQQNNEGSQDSPENPAFVSAAPIALDRTTSDDGGDSSAWETESSDEEDSGSDTEDEDDDIEFSDSDDMDMDEVFLLNPTLTFNIEEFDTSTRANRRPNLDEDEDVMSDFSGDEKYELKGAYSDTPGGGDKDMFDYSASEGLNQNIDDAHLTYKIRQLMLKLTKGRRNRERKLRIESSQRGAASLSPASVSNGAYLHRLIVRGPDHPQEVEHSPAVSFHRQCASSLCVTPSAMGFIDDIFTINYCSIMRCGVLDRMNDSLYHSRLASFLRNSTNYYSTQDGDGPAHRPYAEKLKTVKATKFLRNSIYRFEQLPQEEAYIPLEEGDDPLCMTHKYGYLAMGLNGGELAVFCTCEGEPIEIHNETLADNTLGMRMLNSVQIVRWPRYSRNKVTMSDDDDDEEEENFNGMEQKHDEKDGYPSNSGQFDHYLIITGNEKGLLIAALPDHCDYIRSYDSYDDDDCQHAFKYRGGNAIAIRKGFGGEALNDAKVSPNGRWIAVVGDSANVWTIEVTHVPETEEQRIARLKEEHELKMIKELGTDSDYTTDDSMSEREDMPDESNVKDSIKPSLDDMMPSDYEEEERGGRRLLHQFGQPIQMTIPEKVLFQPQQKRRRHWGFNQLYSSQYVAWNSTSTKFAHSSDTTSRVVVWSMPSREIVCCVDTGGVSFSIEFHPKLENLFAVCNWYGFVHVVDVTGCCVGDEDLVPDNVHVNGQAEVGPGLAGCGGPHYEEKHDIIMLSFRGERDKSLRILDGIRGTGWSTDGRYLYVATLRRVLRYELADPQFRVPSLFQQCARKVKEWKEKSLNILIEGKDENENRRCLDKINKEFSPMDKEWEYVPYSIKRRIWGDTFLMRSHDE